MTLRQADAALAERYLCWRWVAGNGPIGFGSWDGDWLLPEEMHLPDVKADQWEMLDDCRQGRFTVKTLPAFTSDIAAAWMLVEHLEELELVKVGGRWRCRIGAVEVLADNGALAIARAAFKVAPRR